MNKNDILLHINKTNKYLLKQGTKLVKSESFKRVLASFLSAFGGVVLGIILMCIINIQEVGRFIGVLTASNFRFDTNVYVLGPLVNSAPIILTGLSVGFAFKTGLFNIGAPGQLLVGAIAGIYVGLSISLPAPLHFIVAMIAAILAGALWGAITGLLKAFYNINEVVTSIMMNYIAAYLVKYLVKMSVVYDFLRAQTKMLPISATIPTLGLNNMFPNSGFDISIFIAIIVAILIYFILNKTTLGYQLKAVGFNKDAALNAGIKYRRNIITSMTIAGALSGLAGAMIFLSYANQSMIKAQVIIPKEGFDGISIALLALNHPLGIIFSSYFVRFITHFGSLIEGFSTFKKEISDVIISVIIYFSALSSMVLYFINMRGIKRKKLKSLEKEKMEESYLKVNDEGGTL